MIDIQQGTGLAPHFVKGKRFELLRVINAYLEYTNLHGVDSEDRMTKAARNIARNGFLMFNQSDSRFINRLKQYQKKGLI